MPSYVLNKLDTPHCSARHICMHGIYQKLPAGLMLHPACSQPLPKLHSSLCSMQGHPGDAEQMVALNTHGDPNAHRTDGTECLSKQTMLDE